MSIIEKTLNEKLEDINKHLEMVEVMLGECREIPDYKVRVTSGNGCSQYYYRNDANEYIYIPSAKRDFAKRLIQKDYYNPYSLKRYIKIICYLLMPLNQIII